MESEPKEKMTHYRGFSPIEKETADEMLKCINQTKDGALQYNAIIRYMKFLEAVQLRNSIEG